MPSVCPSCQRLLPPRSQCPHCASARRGNFAPEAGDFSSGWVQSTPGRVLASLLLAWALSHGLSQMAGAALQALGITASHDLFSGSAVPLFCFLQALALAAVGMVMAAGRRNGLLTGAGIGLVSGLAIVTLASLNSPARTAAHPGAIYAGVGLPLKMSLLYLLPLMLALAGAVGGIIGMRVWQPLEFPAVPAAAGGSFSGVSVALPSSGARPALPAFGPLSWLRMLVGIVFGIGVGLCGGRQVIAFILSASEGALKIDSQFQERIATVEVFAVAILFGGCLAGATTRSGLRHGIGVGIGCAIVIVGLFMGGAIRDLGDPAPFIFASVFLAPLGGWFGGGLLPPGVRKRKKKRRIIDL